jgi:DNA repair exonuclease SbcCD nuclease subunit
MVKFAHMSDIHLGGWKYKPLQDLNFQSFKKAIDICIKEKVDFVIMCGDIFDTAFPPIEILKEAFSEFRRLKESNIPCFIIAGSHDYSVSGKTFLDVLEKAGFCKNVADFEEKNGKIFLNPTLYKGVAIYGYPGKTSGLEINDLRKAELNDAPGFFKIIMLHTTIDKAKGDLPIDALETSRVPKADYYALGHLHIDFQYENFFYPGPIFPNSFQELEDLEYGRFLIVETKNFEINVKKISLKIKEVVPFDIEITNTITATEKIISELNKKELEDKIVLLRIHGEIEHGKISEIKFSQIEDFVFSKKAYAILRNTHDLKTNEFKTDIKIEETEDIEKETIKEYSLKNNHDFNKFIPQLIHSLSTEKQEGETTEGFNSRLLEEMQKIFNF